MAMEDAHRCFAACFLGGQGIQIRDKCSEGGHIETKTRSARKGVGGCAKSLQVRLAVASASALGVHLSVHCVSFE